MVTSYLCLNLLPLHFSRVVINSSSDLSPHVSLNISCPNQRLIIIIIINMDHVGLFTLCSFQSARGAINILGIKHKKEHETGHFQVSTEGKN